MRDAAGNVLCTISLKKANWYIRKGLAEWIASSSGSEEYEKCIRLSFQPSMRRKDPSQKTYATPKKNACVACAKDDMMMRHYIVPHCYRSCFSDVYKTHLAHDIVLLCPDCHVGAERQAHRRMLVLEGRLRDYPESAVTFHTDSKLNEVRSRASALLKHRAKLPPAQVVAYEDAVRRWSGRSELDKGTLTQIASMNVKFSNPAYISGPDLVHQKLLCGGEPSRIEGFVKDWPYHFVDTMQPRHMPVGWNVDLPVKCDDRSS